MKKIILITLLVTLLSVYFVNGFGDVGIKTITPDNETSDFFYLEIDKFNIKRDTTITINVQNSTEVNFTSALINGSDTDNTTIRYTAINSVQILESDEIVGSNWINYINVTNLLTDTNVTTDNPIQITGTYSSSAQSTSVFFYVKSGENWITYPLTLTMIDNPPADGNWDFFRFDLPHDLNTSETREYRLVAPKVVTPVVTPPSGGGGGGGGADPDCSITSDCFIDFGLNYYCFSGNCILNTSSILALDYCNYNGICEPTLGEDWFNCRCDPFKGECGDARLENGDCQFTNIFTDFGKGTDDSSGIVYLRWISIIALGLAFLLWGLPRLLDKKRWIIIKKKMKEGRN